MRGYRIAVAGVVVNGDKVLIGKKVSSKGHLMSQEWHIPGGKADFGEGAENALIREIKEEAGIDISVVELLDEKIIPSKGFRVLWYLCKALTLDVVPSDDIGDAKFVHKSKLRGHCSETAISLWPDKVVKFIDG